MKDGKHSESTMLLVSVFYGFCSGSMNFINKFLLTSWSFNQPALMLFLQLPVLVFGLKILKWSGKIKLVEYDWRVARSCASLSLLYSTNTVVALIALSGMNVPMYNALRRCIPMVSMLLGYAFFNKQPSHQVFFSVFVITIGAGVAAIGDLDFAIKPYMMGVTSTILMSLHLLVLQHNGSEKRLSFIDLLYVNSINCIPVVALMCLGTLPNLLSYPHLNNPYFICSFLLVVGAGCLLNYSMFLCTVVNSALTTTCVGVIKSGIAALIGIYAFGGIKPTPAFLIGQAINFSGGLMYALAKYRQSKVKNNVLSKVSTSQV